MVYREVDLTESAWFWVGDIWYHALPRLVEHCRTGPPQNRFVCNYFWDFDPAWCSSGLFGLFIYLPKKCLWSYKSFPAKSNTTSIILPWFTRKDGHIKQCFIVSLDSLEHPDTFYVPGAKQLLRVVCRPPNLTFLGSEVGGWCCVGKWLDQRWSYCWWRKSCTVEISQCLQGFIQVRSLAVFLPCTT